MKTGSQTVFNGQRWIETHRAEWLALQKTCLELEAARDVHGRPLHNNVTRGNVYMLAELDGIEISNDFTFRRDHDLWSVLSRYLTEIHPQLSRVIRHRECDVAKYVRAHGLPKLKRKYIYRAA